MSTLARSRVHHSQLRRHAPLTPTRRSVVHLFALTFAFTVGGARVATTCAAPDTQPAAHALGDPFSDPTSPATGPAAQPAATAPGAVASLATTTQPATPTTATPATAPTTAPTTHPSVASVADLIAALSQEPWKSRERAASELVKAGEEARAPLEQVIRTTHNLDVRTSAQDALRQIDDNRIAGPSFVTLHLKDVPAKQAFEALAKQAFVDFEPWPDNLWEQGQSFPNVTLWVDRVPFWSVMKVLSERTGLGLREMNGHVRLVQGQPLNGRAHVAGAFLVLATQIDRSQTLTIGAADNGANPAAAEENFGLQLTALAEPKLTVLRSDGNVKIDQAVDDKGNSLVPTDAESSAQGYFGGGGGNGMWSLYARLHYPSDPGTKIARFRGSVQFIVQVRSQKISIANLPAASEHTEVVRGTRITIHDFKKGDGDQYTLKLSIKQPGGVAVLPAGADQFTWEELQSSIQTHLQVQDARGQSLDHRGWSSSTRNDAMEITLTFAASQSTEGKPTGDPVKLSWEIPVETRELIVPIEFDNLPMPRK